MKTWQKRALMAVFGALDKVPSGFAASASTTPRALVQAARIRDAVIPQAQLVLESLAFNDERDTVEAKVLEMTNALDAVTEALRRDDEEFEAARKRAQPAR